MKRNFLLVATEPQESRKRNPRVLPHSLQCVGSTALVASGNALRSHRRRISNTEHCVDQRRTRPRKLAQRQLAQRRRDPPSPPLQARAPDSLLWLFPAEGEAAQDVRRIPRQEI